VCKWCQDTWHDNYKSAPIDGSAWETEGVLGHHVLRGGSWYDDVDNCYAAARILFTRNYRGDLSGFRVCTADLLEI